MLLSTATLERHIQTEERHLKVNLQLKRGLPITRDAFGDDEGLKGRMKS
jgi:hypothetical protein